MEKIRNKFISIVLAFMTCTLSGYYIAACAKLKAMTPIQKATLAINLAEWGIKADHDFCDNKCWISDSVMAKFEEYVSLAKDTVAKNPTTAIGALIAFTQSWEAKLPSDDKLRPYIDAGLTYLQST